MILSGRTLRKLILHPSLGKPLSERLIITPILDPESQIALGSASVDIRLGKKFRVPKRAKISHLDHINPDHQLNIEKYKEETFVPLGDYFVLHPKQFVLGETLEWVHLPHDIAAYVIGRSSWGRDGLIIATATGVHPGYSGILTLEISNIGEIPIFLWPGLTIAQLFVESVAGAEVGDRDPSAFRGSTEPRNANAAARDKDIIAYFQGVLSGPSNPKTKPTK